MQKKILSLILVFSFLFYALFPSSQVHAATLQKSETFVEGSTAKIKFTGNRKAVKWSVSNERVLKIVTEKKSYIKVKGLKPGNAAVYATIGKDTYKCKIKVEEQEAKEWILNTETRKFHYPSCKDIKKMSKENKEAVSLKYKEVIEQGYSPCGHCKPKP